MDKIPHASKFSIKKVPKKIEGLGLHQQHYYVKGRNTISVDIQKNINAVRTGFENGGLIDKRYLLKLKFGIYCLNGNRKKALQLKEKIEKVDSDMLTEIMFSNRKYREIIDDILVEVDSAPDQLAIDFGEKIIDDKKKMEWAIKYMNVYSTTADWL